MIARVEFDNLDHDAIMSAVSVNADSTALGKQRALPTASHVRDVSALQVVV